MATDRQIAANRLNAKKSTGPKTPEGKRRSRINAFRHGLTAETVIGILEDADEYKAFEAEIITGSSPCSSIEHSLASRLASLLWRMRRATAIESGLFETQAQPLRQQPASNDPHVHTIDEKLNALFNLNRLPAQRQRSAPCDGRDQSTSNSPLDEPPRRNSIAKSDLTQSFMQLANSDHGAFDRLGRYEMCLWRQAAQTIGLINSFKWRAEDARRHSRRRLRSTQQRRHHLFPVQFYRQR
jgi:hypothetical protein